MLENNHFQFHKRGTLPQTSTRSRYGAFYAAASHQTLAYGSCLRAGSVLLWAVTSKHMVSSTGHAAVAAAAMAFPSPNTAFARISTWLCPSYRISLSLQDVTCRPINTRSYLTAYRPPMAGHILRACTGIENSCTVVICKSSAMSMLACSLACRARDSAQLSYLLLSLAHRHRQHPPV